MDPKQISKYFTWTEGLFLPSWSRLATEADGLTAINRTNLVIIFSKMDTIREYFNSPIHVHVAYRPLAYNALVGGAKNSAHIAGLAVDFDIAGVSCDDARQRILDARLLDSLGLRMEKNPGSSWVHLDAREILPGGNRYFQP